MRARAVTARSLLTFRVAAMRVAFRFIAHRVRRQFNTGLISWIGSDLANHRRTSAAGAFAAAHAPRRACHLRAPPPLVGSFRFYFFIVRYYALFIYYALCVLFIHSFHSDYSFWFHFTFLFLRFSSVYVGFWFCKLSVYLVYSFFFMPLHTTFFICGIFI